MRTREVTGEWILTCLFVPPLWREADALTEYGGVPD